MMDLVFFLKNNNKRRRRKFRQVAYLGRRRSRNVQKLPQTSEKDLLGVNFSFENEFPAL